MFAGIFWPYIKTKTCQGDRSHMNLINNIRLPLPFIIFGIIHLLFPGIIIIILKESSSLSFDLLIAHINVEATGLSWFNFWLLFPLAGLAIFFAHKVTYPIVIFAHWYSIFSILLKESVDWGFLNETLQFSPFYLFTFNMIMISYFLAPKSAKVFFTAGSRWWDTKTRYITNIPCVVTLNDVQEIKNCFVKNISQSGAFIIGDLPMVKYMNNVMLKFTFQNEEYLFKSDIVGTHATNESNGHGLKFTETALIKKIKLRILIWKISKEADQKQRWEVPTE